MKKLNLIGVIFLVLIISCKQTSTDFAYSVNKNIELSQKKLTTIINDSSSLEKYLVSKKMIDVNSIDSSIRVSLIYSTTNNFLKKNLYNGLTKCYLPKEVALKLVEAQRNLKKDFPLYNLIIFDAVRPLSIQKIMWKELDLPNNIKINYLANPSAISLHNYGAAIDLGIIGENQVLLNMGSSFDFFGELSEPKKENKMFLNGELSKECYANRLLLRSIMIKTGWLPITSEWWHFNYCSKILAASKFELIE